MQRRVCGFGGFCLELEGHAGGHCIRADVKGTREQLADALAALTGLREQRLVDCPVSVIWHAQACAWDPQDPGAAALAETVCTCEPSRHEVPDPFRAPPARARP